MLYRSSGFAADMSPQTIQNTDRAEESWRLDCYLIFMTCAFLFCIVLFDGEAEGYLFPGTRNCRSLFACCQRESDGGGLEEGVDGVWWLQMPARADIDDLHPSRPEIFDQEHLPIEASNHFSPSLHLFSA